MTEPSATTCIDDVLSQAIASHDAGDLSVAEAYYQEILRRQRNHFEACHLLGYLYLQTACFDDAAKYLEQAILLRQDNPNTFLNLGIANRNQGLIEQSVAHLETATRLRPDDHLIWSELSVSQHMMGLNDEAIVSAQNAVNLAPETADYYYNLGSMFLQIDDFLSAITTLEKAVSIAPDYTDAHCNLGLANMFLARHKEALASFKTACRLDPLHREANGNIIFVMTSMFDISTQEIFQHATAFGNRLHAALNSATEHRQPVDRNPDRRLKVGFLSRDFQHHPVGYLLRDVIGAIDPDDFELFAYVPGEDLQSSLQTHFKDVFDRWVRLGDMDESSIARRIAEDGVDILIDLAGHTRGNKIGVFACKPAPVQVTWLGFAATTGIPGMDYILGDKITLPDNHGDAFTETPWRMPETSFCYAPPEEDCDISPPPYLRNGYITFGSVNNFVKLGDEVVELWSRLLRELPDSRLILKNPTARRDFGFSDLTKARFFRHGIAPERISIEVRSSRRELWGRYGEFDVGLDPFPSPGGATTMDALWMGVPVLRLRGDRFSSRVGDSILTAIGHQDLIAEDEDDFIAKATSFANHPEQLLALRENLRKNLQESRICDPKGFASDLSATLRDMWRKHCEGEAEHAH